MLEWTSVLYHSLYSNIYLYLCRVPCSVLCFCQISTKTGSKTSQCQISWIFVQLFPSWYKRTNMPKLISLLKLFFARASEIDSSSHIFGITLARRLQKKGVCFYFWKHTRLLDLSCPFANQLIEELYTDACRFTLSVIAHIGNYTIQQHV